MSSFKITGKLILKKPVQVISEKFRKMEFVMETQEQFPQRIPFYLANDKVGMLDSTAVGNIFSVHFNIRGSEYTPPGKEVQHFTSLEAWKFE